MRSSSQPFSRQSGRWSLQSFLYGARFPLQPGSAHGCGSWRVHHTLPKPCLQVGGWALHQLLPLARNSPHPSSSHLCLVLLTSGGVLEARFSTPILLAQRSEILACFAEFAAQVSALSAIWHTAFRRRLMHLAKATVNLTLARATHSRTRRLSSTDESL